jgi:inner membrane protease ATP23
MYDNTRAKDYDPTNCNHLACSEIRAANLGGYCSDEYSYVDTITQSGWNKKRMEDCIKSKATEHMMVYYEHCEDKSSSYVSNVWLKCYADKSPLKDFYREKSYL